MSNLSFHKNSFIKNKPAVSSKPINTNSFGRRTIEEIKTDMYSINKPKQDEIKPKFEDLQKSQKNNSNFLKSFREWNRK